MRSIRSRGPRRTLIRGTGMAGLVAANELARNPAVGEVLLLEGSNRIGGRLMMHRFGPEPEPGEKDSRLYHELGGMTSYYSDSRKPEGKLFFA